MASEIRRVLRDEKGKPKTLTDAAVAKLKPERGMRTVYPDSETLGLELRIAPDGTRSFALLYRVKGDTKKRRITIGDYPTMKLGDARETARGYRNHARAGRDPAAEREQQIAERAERRSNTVGASRRSS